MGRIEAKREMVNTNPAIPMITLNVNGLYKTIKSQRSRDLIKEIKI